MLKIYISSAENHFSGKGYKCVTIRTDNGGEFKSKEFADYLYNKGIHQQFTVSYNSSQNGVAERYHRTIKDKVKVLLKSSGMQLHFWTEAVKTAEFLVNRYPSERLKDKSPFELWYGYKPQRDIWHPFGVECRVLLPPEKRMSVFTPGTVDGIFIGYATAMKAYKVYIPELKSIFISNNVVFNDLPYLQGRYHTLQNDGQLLDVDQLFLPVVGTSDPYFDSST